MHGLAFLATPSDGSDRGHKVEERSLFDGVPNCVFLIESIYLWMNNVDTDFK